MKQQYILLLLLIMLFSSKTSADGHFYPNYGVGSGDSISYRINIEIQNNSIQYDNPFNLAFFGSLNTTLLLYDDDVFSILFGEFTPESQVTPQLVAGTIAINNNKISVNNIPELIYHTINDWDVFANISEEAGYDVMRNTTHIGYVDRIAITEGNLYQSTNYTIMYDVSSGLMSFFELDVLVDNDFYYTYLIQIREYDENEATGTTSMVTSSPTTSYSELPTVSTPKTSASNNVTYTSAFTLLIGIGTYIKIKRRNL